MSPRFCPVCGQGFPATTSRCPIHEVELGPPDTLIGAVVSGRYRIEDRVGAGGMGAVYRAVQLDLDRNVAIKVVSSSALENPETARRFTLEAQIIARLHHPATLKLFDFGRLSDGRPFLVTEFLEGDTLGALLERGPLPWRRAFGLLAQVCASLQEAHGQGVIHRDLKPDNVFVSTVHEEDVAKVLDFGIAKLGASTQTATGFVFGTPTYMSPEQASGQSATLQSDLYSLGVIAYRCLAGRPPFECEEPMALLLKHINEAPSWVSHESAQPLPIEVEQLVMRLLEKDPALRPTSAEAVRQTIEQALRLPPEAEHAEAAFTEFTGDEPTSIQIHPASGPLPTIPHGPSASALALAASALVLGVATAIWVGYRGDPIEVVEIAPSPPPAPKVAPPPLEPVRAEPEPEPDVAPPRPTATPKPVPVEPRTKRRPKRRRKKAPEDFYDFELD